MNEKMEDVTPMSPGAVLRERILANLKVTQDQLADALGVSRLSVNQLLNGKRSVTPEMALRLAKVLGTEPELWLNLQNRFDLLTARQKLGPTLETLRVLRKQRSDDEVRSRAIEAGRRFTGGRFVDE